MSSATWEPELCSVDGSDLLPSLGLLSGGMRTWYLGEDGW